MRSFPSLALKAVRGFPGQIAFALALVLLASLCAAAQQPAAGRKRNPRLTTDDVVQPATDQPATDAPKDAPKEAAPAKPEETAKTQPVAKTNGGQASAEEAAWRERIVKARERAKQTERAADEAELRITELRNQLGESGQTAKDRNETAAEMERAGLELNELRKQARAAAEDVNQLLEHGKARGYQEADGPKATTADGKANEEFYRERYAKLLEDATRAERQIQVYENRVRDVSQRILMNGGKNGGDNFYLMQLQQEKQDYQQKLDEARASSERARNDLGALMEEANRAGVPPGVFK